jgi:hypothetical protein
VRAMLATPEGEAELPDLKGVQRIFAHVPLTGTGARLAVGIDRAMVLKRVDQQRMFSLAMLNRVYFEKRSFSSSGSR